MQYEYDSLWKELLEWQGRRVNLLTSSVTVVTAVLGIGQGFADHLPWWTITTLLLLMLSSTGELTTYAGYVNQRIGSFLEVFHDPKAELRWEHRNQQFAKTFHDLQGGKPKRLPSLNKQLFHFYSLLGFLSLSLPPLLFRGSVSLIASQDIIFQFIPLLAVVLATLVYLLVLYRLYHSQSRRDELRKTWIAIREAEHTPSGQGTVSDAEPGVERERAITPVLKS